MKLAGGSVVKGILSISAGTALAQVLTVGAAPVIARIYSPDDVGIYTIIAAVASILAVISGLRWDFAIPIPTSESDAQSLVALGLISVAGSTLLFTTVILLWGDDICAAVNEPRLMPWMILAPLISGSAAAMRLLNQLAVRNRRYASIGGRSIFRSVIMVLSQIGLGIVGFRTGGLVIGLGAGNTAGAISLMHGAGLRSEAARSGRALPALRRVAVQYRRFPMLLAPSGLLNVLGLQVPILLIFSLYGSTVAGWLGLTLTVLALPVALLGQAVAQVYLGELARSMRKNELAHSEMFRQVTRSLCLLGSILALVLMAAAPTIFPIVFGETWRTSGEYARALGPALGLQMLAVPLSQTLTMFGRQGTQLSWDAGRLLLTAGAVFVCSALGGSAAIAVWCLGISSALAYLILWWLSRHAVSKRFPVMLEQP